MGAFYLDLGLELYEIRLIFFLNTTKIYEFTIWVQCMHRYFQTTNLK